MPCYDPRNDIKEVVYEKGHDPYYKDEAKRLSDRCHKLTDLLCKVGRACYKKTLIPNDVIEWWEEHRRIDAFHGNDW